MHRPMSATAILREIGPRNLLSFGPETAPLTLGPLNVLIGPNGSGKSNLLEAIALLRGLPSEDGLRQRISGGGGMSGWTWKGEPLAPASLEAAVGKGALVRHTIVLEQVGDAFEVREERIEDDKPISNVRGKRFLYSYKPGSAPTIRLGGKQHSLNRKDLALDQSVLAQRRDPDHYRDLSILADFYKSIRIYREWSFGHTAVFRRAQAADLRNDYLLEDFSNLGLFINRLRSRPAAKRALLTALRDIYDGFEDFDVIIQGGQVQVFFVERGDFTIPATRLSDGTLRYLCLLAILCDPEPPPLVCIEEPELGLHPDILPKLADLLVAASGRTQLIVTTHSDILVDALTEYPEAVVVCEKHDGQTRMQRLDGKVLAHWLERYRLGELWTRGEIGGVRW